MNAVIYAAGRALRLGPKSAECPKILLPIGGQTLLERHVALLREAGVDQIAVVTGHRRELVAEEIARLRTRWSAPLEELYNDKFAQGSVLSMAASVPWLKAQRESVLIMDGDVLYDQRLLARLVGVAAIDGAAAGSWLFHRGRRSGARTGAAGKAVRVSQTLAGGAPSSSASRSGSSRSPCPIWPCCTTRSRSALSPRARTSRTTKCCAPWFGRVGLVTRDVTGVPWTEIDFPEDPRLC